MATDGARAAKERKQKIFVAVGGIVLLALLAFQLPKLLGGSGSSAAPPLETTTVGGETVPGAQAPTGGPVALVDTDPRLAVGPGQLGSFTFFRPKDPFVQQVVAATPSVQLPRGGASEAADKPVAKGFSGSAVTVSTVTIVSVNGRRHVLEPGATFPPANPVFVLVAEQPKAKAVVIGLPGGEYADGARKTRLRAGKPLLLENTTTGARYRLVLVTVGGKRTPAKKR